MFCEYDNVKQLQSDWRCPVQGARTTLCIASHHTLSQGARLHETSKMVAGA